MRAHDGEAGVDDTVLALLDLVDDRLHVVVDAPARDAAQRSERAGVGVEQHFVSLARVGHQPERAARAQLQVRDLHAPVDPTHHQPFLAPIKLERLAELEGQRNKRLGRCNLAFALAPGPDEVGQAAAAALVALRLDLSVQRPGGSPLVLGNDSGHSRRFDWHLIYEMRQEVRGPWIAPPGGVVISGATQEAVRSRLPATFEDLGAQHVKNMPYQVQAFRVCSDNLAVARTTSPSGRDGQETQLQLQAAGSRARRLQRVWVGASIVVFGVLLAATGAAWRWNAPAPITSTKKS